MNTPQSDVDELIEALRDDLPRVADKERTRARLLAAGIIVGAGMTAKTAGASMLTAAGVKSGLLPELYAMSWVSKVGLITTVIATGTAIPVAVHYVESANNVEQPAASIADGRRSIEKQASKNQPVPNPPNEDLTHQDPAKHSEQRQDRAEHNQPQRPKEPREEARPTPSRHAPDNRRTQNTPPTIAHPIQRPVDNSLESADPQGSFSAAASFPAIKDETEVTHERELPRDSAMSRASVIPRERVRSTLQQETELIERALAALRARDPATALSFLNQHARNFPNGVLARERNRALARAQAFHP